MRTSIQEELEDLVVAYAIGPARRVLDCGCGTGRIARRLDGCEVDGIELSASAAEAARMTCRRVITGSVTDPAAWEALDERRYDAIIFCHVLEHLTDPLAAIALARRQLASDGRMVIVLPNVATWRMRWHLLRGRWDYKDEGILDRTHVKFYTLDSAREFVAGAGLQIRDEQLLGTPPAGSALRRMLVRGLRRFSDRATAQAFLFVTTPRA